MLLNAQIFGCMGLGITGGLGAMGGLGATGDTAQSTVVAVTIWVVITFPVLSSRLSILASYVVPQESEENVTGCPQMCG